MLKDVFFQKAKRTNVAANRLPEQDELTDGELVSYFKDGTESSDEADNVKLKWDFLPVFIHHFLHPSGVIQETPKN